MAYPTDKPEDIYTLIDYDFGINDPNLIPLDENSFKRGFRNKDESELDSVPDAHQANWLYSYYNRHIRYTELTAEENKRLLETKIATPTSIGQIMVGYGLDITPSGTLSVSRGVAEDASIISYDLPVGSFMLWSGNNPPEYFIEPVGQTLLRSNYPELWEFAQSNSLVGQGKLFQEGDGSTTFVVADCRNQFIKIGASGDIVGRKEAEGLPDISGTVTTMNSRFSSGGNGAFAGSNGRKTGSASAYGGTDYGGNATLRFNASNSNSIYGKSSHVTPRNIAFKLILKAKPTPPNKTVPIGSVLDYTGTTAPDGFIIANGAELSRTTFADLFNWAVANSLLREQSSIPSTAHAYYGTGDGSTTFTIPDLRGVFRRGADLLSGRGSADVGVYQQDGLPNITGGFQVSNLWVHSNAASGAFTDTYVSGTNNAGNGGTRAQSHRFDFNASRSSSIYGRSNYVQPKNVSMLPILKY